MTNEKDIWIINILRENKSLLQRNDFDALYEKIRKEWGNSYFTRFTKFFLNNGINPLSYFKKEIPEWCFSGTRIRESVLDINEGILKIHGSAFCNCLDLVEITIPSSLVEIGDSVFKNCKNLKKVTFKSIPKIKGPLFSNNPRLTDINVPKPKDDQESIRTKWFVNHLYYRDIDADKININYI